MMNEIGRVIFWRYPRGSWQYDILCALILLFIFLTPRAIFDGSFFSDTEEHNIYHGRVDQTDRSEDSGEHSADIYP